MSEQLQRADPQDILVDRPASGVVRITLNRPDARNALRTQTLSEIAAELVGCAAADDVGAVVLTGGPTFFAAGADLREMASLGPMDVLARAASPLAHDRDLSEASGRCRQRLRARGGLDLLAGVSVAAVAVPVAIAYSQLAGVPPVYGLYASLLPLVAYAFLGSSRQLIVAPDAATCAIIAAVVAPLAGQDPSRYVSLTAALAVITGVLCIGAGLARLGFLANFLARPILTGYINGIALSIITGQLGTLFGFRLEPAGFFRSLWQYFSKLGQTHGPTLAVGAATLALLLLLARAAPKVPGPLVAVALSVAGSDVFGLSGLGRQHKRR